MATATLSPPQTTSKPHPPQQAVYRFSVEQYHGMIDRGILTTDDRCELVDGWILAKMTQNPPHVWTMLKSTERITRELPARWCVRPQVPITTDLSEPEPDLAVVRGDNADYATRHPGPADVGMLIEIADSSLSIDRSIKSPAYARARIPVYWIINLIDEQIEVHSDPAVSEMTAAYQTKTVYVRGESVPLVLDGKQIALIPVNDLLP